MNPQYREAEVAHCMALAQVAAVVVAEAFRGQRYYDLLAAVVPELPHCAPGQLHSEALPDLKAVITMATQAPP